jgi:hypothetical protein
MDRKLCVLIYSKQSIASKNIVEFIQKLPYDFVKVTGMTLLCIDSKEVRDVMQKKSITTVPCLIVQYFDGTNQLFENDQIYAWINAIHDVISTSNVSAYIPHNAVPRNTTLLSHVPDLKDETAGLTSNLTNIPEINLPTKKSTKKQDALSLAAEMQKLREQDIKAMEKIKI